MSEKTTHIWHGFGTNYEYSVYALPHRPPNGALGNYIFVKSVRIGWEAVYIGQGILSERYDAALKECCVTRKEATHYHFHLNNNKDARKEEEEDLIFCYPECKWPDGCNGYESEGCDDD